MIIYHQTGHNFKWNMDSFKEDNVGNGLIFSPVNIPYQKLIALDRYTKEQSFFDPQFYRMNDSKAKLDTYDFFPGNLKDDFNTSDLGESFEKIAYNYINFQITNNFKYIIIPCRYYNNWTSRYYEEFLEYLIKPFIKYYLKSNTKQKLLLTLIIKQNDLIDDDLRNELLSLITGIKHIDGIYIIFENNFTSKQIKDSDYLFKTLQFIHVIKDNGLEIHIGYTNVEGILYSIANPDSVSIGSYENLRDFDFERFKTQEENTKRQPPRPRLYSAKLFQWIDHGFIDSIKRLYKNYNSIFEKTKYTDLIFQPGFKWHFTKPELYKHYFVVFNRQVQELPQKTNDRVDILTEQFSYAINCFNDIKNSGVYLDPDSDGSHLYFWITALNSFKQFLKG